MRRGSGAEPKGRALTDEEIIKVWHASGKLGAFGRISTHVPTRWPAPQRADHDRVAQAHHG